MQALFWFLVVLQYSAHNVWSASYSKVAKWGAAQLSTDENEGRSNGQSLFTHRSDVSLRAGQNLNTNKPKENVVYQYSRPANMQKPVKIQGFQDRFNPPPIFQFGHSKGNDEEQFKDDATLVFSESKKTLYDSPISSYNPAPSGIPSNVPKFQTNGPIYPPFLPTQPTVTNDFKNAPVNDNANDNNGENSDGNPNGNDNDYGDNDNNKPDTGYQYNPPVQSVPRPNVPKLQNNGPVFSAFMPNQAEPVDDFKNAPIPDANHDNDNDNINDYDTDSSDEKPDNGYHYHPPVPSISFTSPSPKPFLENPNHHFKFPAYVYDTNASDVIVDHPPSYPNHHHEHHPHPEHHEHHDHRDYPTIDSFKTSELANFPEYLDHHPSFAKVVDHYPSDSFHFEEPHDHYIHKIKPTTTTTPPPPPPPAKEEKRVNKGHYSYYYLGRKLYYIPLYFSVYFIIYITVLILKSIARHKVTFAYDLRDVAQGRSLSSNNNEKLDEVQEQTTKAIINFKRRFIAM